MVPVGNWLPLLCLWPVTGHPARCGWGRSREAGRRSGVDGTLPVAGCPLGLVFFLRPKKAVPPEPGPVPVKTASPTLKSLGGLNPRGRPQSVRHSQIVHTRPSTFWHDLYFAPPDFLMKGLEQQPRKRAAIGCERMDIFPLRVLERRRTQESQRGLRLSIGGKLNQFVTPVFNGRTGGCSRTRKVKEMWGRGGLKRQPYCHDWPLVGADVDGRPRFSQTDGQTELGRTHFH